MFETASIRRHKQPWTFAVSLAVQCAAAALTAVLSILHVDRIEAAGLKLPLPPLTPVRAMKIVEAQPSRGSGAGASQPLAAQPRVFVEPSSIPPGVARILDDGAAFAMAEAPSLGVASGVPASSTVPFGVDDRVSISTPATPERKAPETARHIHAGGAVMEARIVHRVLPAYPPPARQARISGTVQLTGVIARDGTIQQLQVVSGHPLLTQAAVDAVRQWRYRPTLLNGQPVEVIAPITVHFTLTQ